MCGLYVLHAHAEDGDVEEVPVTQRVVETVDCHASDSEEKERDDSDDDNESGIDEGAQEKVNCFGIPLMFLGAAGGEIASDKPPVPGKPQTPKTPAHKAAHPVISPTPTKAKAAPVPTWEEGGAAGVRR